MSRQEYHEFGPWIHEIKEAEQIPRLFGDYPIDLSQSLMTIKIPRNIEWRDANQDMDLYEYLIDIRPDRITALQRMETSFAVAQIAMADIKAVVNAVDVLKGILTLYTSERSFAIRYNGCSEAVIQRVMNIIRQHYLSGKETTRPFRPVPLAVDSIEYALQTYHKGLLSEQSDLALIAAQNRRRLKPVYTDLRHTIGKILFPMELCGALFYSNGKELVVLSRTAPIKRRFNPAYSVSYTYIPLSNISSVSRSDSPEYHSLVNLQIKTATETFVFTFDEANEQREIVAGLIGA